MKPIDMNEIDLLLRSTGDTIRQVTEADAVVIVVLKGDQSYVGRSGIGERIPENSLAFRAMAAIRNWLNRATS